MLALHKRRPEYNSIGSADLTVNPVFLIPHARNHTRPKRASRIQAAASVVNADHLCHEEREPDTDRSHESGFVLLVGQHVDGKHQFAGKDGFDLDGTG